MGIVKVLPAEICRTEEDLLRAPATPARTTRGAAAPDPARLKLQTLLRVSELLSLPEAADDLPQLTVRLLPQIVDVERAVLLLADPATGELAIKAQHATVPVPPSSSPYSRHIVQHALENNVAVLSLDALSDGRFSEAQSIVTQSIRSLMCAPLRGRKGLMGVLYADNVTQPEIFGEDDLRLLVGFANQVAIALDNGALYRQIADDARRLYAFLRARGYPHADPHYTLLFLPLDSLPDVRLTYRGVWDVRRGKALAPREDLPC